MTGLELWFPEDFDKRYAEYRKKFIVEEDRKMPDPFLAERLKKAQEDLLAITDEEEFQHEMDQWRPLKTVVDAIYKQLSPLAGDAQSVKIDLAKLDVSENQATPILLTLVYERVCRWRFNKSSAVISSVPVHEYLAGDGIVVPDYEKFQELRKDVNGFYKFIEDEKARRFSNAKSVEKTEAPKEEVDSATKRVGVWDGEVVSDLPLIDYNDATGKGEVVGKKKFKFKDGSPEFKVFTALYAKLGKKKGAKLERQDVLIAGGFYEDHEAPEPARKTAETAFINDIAKGIREKTGLDTDHLVNNNGNLTLLALRQDKNPPKVIQYVPVWG